jgi:hypothetical protein
MGSPETPNGANEEFTALSPEEALARLTGEQGTTEAPQAPSLNRQSSSRQEAASEPVRPAMGEGEVGTFVQAANQRRAFERSYNAPVRQRRGGASPN